jgi:hypothetical protein
VLASERHRSAERSELAALGGSPDQSAPSDGGPGDDVCVSVAAGSKSCEI